jgi:hypothetical protein
MSLPNTSRETIGRFVLPLRNVETLIYLETDKLYTIFLSIGTWVQLASKNRELMVLLCY